MAKVTFNTLLANFASITKLNANFTTAATAIENTLSRDGTSPNTMSADFDMNSNDILNLPVATNNTSPVRKQEFDAAVNGGVGGTQFRFEETVTATASDANIQVDLPDKELVKIVLFAQPENNNVRLYAQYTTDSFSTVKSGASDYEYANRRFRPTVGGGATLDDVDDSDDASTRIEIMNSHGDQPSEFFQGEIMIYKPQTAALRTGLSFQGWQRNQANFGEFCIGGGEYTTAEATDGVQFSFSAGNIAVMTAHVYVLNAS